MNDLDESLMRAARFIYDVSRPADTPIRAQLEALFGLFVAQRAGVASVLPWLKHAADRVGNSLDQVAVESGFDPYTFDAKLLISCHLAIVKYGTEPSPALGRIAGEISGSLRQFDVIPTSLKGVAFLLSMCGRNRWEFGESSTNADLPSRGQVLMAGADEVRHLCNWVANESSFGNHSLPETVTSELLISFPVVLMQRLREYDLMLGTMLLRSIKYLGESSSPECLYATQFLLAQQCEDGRFGYFARELSSSPSLRNPDQDLSLPITVSTIWSLAELRSMAPVLSKQ